MFSHIKPAKKNSGKKKQKPSVLVVASNSEYINQISDQINECKNIFLVVSKLTIDELNKLYEKHKPDLIVIDGRSISVNANIGYEFNRAYLGKLNRPYIYIDINQSRNVLIDYLRIQKSCATVCYLESGKQVTFCGQFQPGGSEKCKPDNNMNIASVGKLFTVIACYFALRGKTTERVRIHPDIKIPKYIRNKINNGITAEQLIFHQAGLGNYLMNLLTLIKEKKPIPSVDKDTTLSALAPMILENELNMDLQKQIYSNTGYFVLGLAIETAINEGKKPNDPTWKSYYQYVKEQVLADRMPNTTHIQTEKTVINLPLNEMLEHQQLPSTSAGCWYSTADDLYRMMEWVKEKCKVDNDFYKFIDNYNRNHPLHKDNDQDVFMHEGRIDPGVDAFAILNLATSDIFCLVTNSMDWSLSGLQHLVTHQKLSDIALEISERIVNTQRKSKLLSNSQLLFSETQVSDIDMANSTFGRESNTVKLLEKKQNNNGKK